MPTFAARLLAARKGKAPGARPYASEAIAAVLLDRTGLTPADVETGRVIVVASEEAVREAVERLAVVTWRESLIGAGYCTETVVDQGKTILLADEDDLEKPQPWREVAGERGMGVLMTAAGLDVVDETYRLWATRTVALDAVDADGVVPAVVHLVTGRRPTVVLGSYRDIAVSDIRTALGPKSDPNEAVAMLGRLRDARTSAYDRLMAKRRDEAKAKAVEEPKDAAKDLLDGLLDGEPRHERDTPLSELSGFGPARAWGLQLAADLTAYRQGELPWADVDRGVLLSGAPGGGKTRFARALAAEAGVPFHASSFSSLCGGSSSGYNVEKQLKKLFDEARKNVPCIVFFDEMDSVPGRDFKPDHNSSYFNAVNNAFLEVLDGAVPRDGIVVIAATNFPDRIDPALRRPGRLDRHIEIPLPTVDDLAGIIRHHLGTDTSGMDDQLRLAARACRGMSPADVEQACRDARRRARTVLGRSRALPGDVAWVARQRAGEKPEGTDRLTAVHEAGHAVLALALGMRLLNVDADRGHTLVRQTTVPTAAQVEDEITMTMAGRAAEAVLLGEVTSGARIDLAHSTGLATAYHAQYGFGDAVGLMVVTGDMWPVAKAVRELVEECHDRALRLVRHHKDNVERVAEALQRERYLDADEVRALMRHPLLRLVRPPVDEPEGYPDWATSDPKVGRRFVKIQARAA